MVEQVEQRSGNTNMLDPTTVFKKHLPLSFGARVADLGCGSMAYFALAAAKTIGSDGVVYAVDILKEVLSFVTSKAELGGFNNVTTVWSNLEIAGATKIPENMDYVFLVTTIFQNTNHKQVLQEGVRLLKQGGKLLVIEWLPRNTVIGPAVERRVKAETIKEYAAQLGLKLKSEFEPSPYHYGLIFIK